MRSTGRMFRRLSLRSLKSGVEAEALPPKLAAPEERKRPSPVSLEELAREQAREVACEVVRTASPKPVPAPSPVESVPAAPLPAPKEERPSLWCGYPTSIARVSPFFPMNNLEKGRRDALMRDPDITSREKGSIAASGAFFFKEPISSGPWGNILYTGPKLSVEEEDVLMALLAIIESGAEGAEARHARSTGALPMKDTEEGFVPVARGTVCFWRRGGFSGTCAFGIPGERYGKIHVSWPVAADSASDGA